MIRKVFAVCAVAVLLTGFALAADEPAASGAEQSSAKPYRRGHLRRIHAG